MCRAQVLGTNREAGLVAGRPGSRSGPFFPIELAEPAWAVCPSGLWDIWPVTISGEKVWTT